MFAFFFKCSVRCDGGTRVRDVSCYETTTSTLVDDALCTDDKPEDVESCNEVVYIVQSFERSRSNFK